MQKDTMDPKEKARSALTAVFPSTKSIAEFIKDSEGRKRLQSFIEFAACNGLLDSPTRQAFKPIIFHDKIDSGAVPALITAFKNSDGKVRRRSVDAIRKIGFDAAAAVPALINALKDEDRYVCKWAESALGKIGPKAVPALINALEDKDGNVRRRSAMILDKIGLETAAAVPESTPAE